jgi:hypothetical protein
MYKYTIHVKQKVDYPQGKNDYLLDVHKMFSFTYNLPQTILN